MNISDWASIVMTAASLTYIVWFARDWLKGRKG